RRAGPGPRLDVGGGALGRGRRAVAGGGPAPIYELALGLRGAGQLRRGVDVVVLRLVPGPPRRQPRGQRRRARPYPARAPARQGLRYSLGRHPPLPLGAAALRPVFLPVVWLVFLHHLVPHLPARRLPPVADAD